MLTGIFFFGIIVLTMGISLWANSHVKSTYKRFSRQDSRIGLSGKEVAEEILSRSGVEGVKVVAEDGWLSDHYNPSSRSLVLSTANYHGKSVAALGVAAHEVGHALQHAEGYKPLKWRMAAVGVTSYANQTIFLLGLAGMLTGALYSSRLSLILPLLAICWGVVMIFNLVTLPVEFDASKRAKDILGDDYLDERHMIGVKKVLNAAAWTYVAAFVTAFLYFLWYLFPLLSSRRN